MGFIIDETPYAGGKESERVFCVRANNPPRIRTILHP